MVFFSFFSGGPTQNGPSGSLFFFQGHSTTELWIPHEIATPYYGWTKSMSHHQRTKMTCFTFSTNVSKVVQGFVHPQWVGVACWELLSLFGGF